MKQNIMINVVVSMLIGKLFLFGTSKIWDFLWQRVSETSFCDGVMWIVIVPWSVLTLFIIVLVQITLLPQRTTARIVHYYLLICSFNFLEYIFFVVAQGFYFGRDSIKLCPSWKDSNPFVFAVSFFGFGALFFLFEVLFFSFILRDWQLNNEDVV
jgi:hypothetical protein